MVLHFPCEIVQRKAGVMGIVNKFNVMSIGELCQFPVHHFNLSFIEETVVTDASRRQHDVFCCRRDIKVFQFLRFQS